MKWHHRFYNLAEHVSRWSKDPSTKCGAVIVDQQKRIISIGFNGFPAKTKDNQNFYADRNIKYRRVLHAELNAILFAKQDLTGTSIYIAPMLPCAQCAATIIQTGIANIFTKQFIDEEKIDRWNKDFQISIEMFKESGVSFNFL